MLVNEENITLFQLYSAVLEKIPYWRAATNSAEIVDKLESLEKIVVDKIQKLFNAPQS